MWMYRLFLFDFLLTFRTIPTIAECLEFLTHTTIDSCWNQPKPPTKHAIPFDYLLAWYPDTLIPHDTTVLHQLQ